VLILGTMSFVRKKSRKLSSGEIKDYYYEVENKWENGKVKQKIIRYLGDTPYKKQFDINDEKARLVSQILFEKDSDPRSVKERLKEIGLPVPPGELKEVHLVYEKEIYLEPDEIYCPVCFHRLTVRNTKRRTIRTMTGLRNVVTVTKHCPIHTDNVFSPTVRLTPRKSIHGFDVIAEVGKLRFMDHKQIDEIHSILLTSGIPIPPRTVESLCSRFLHCLMAVHLGSLPAVSTILEKQGGYVCHVDGTTTKGDPVMLLIKDSCSKIRLLAASIPSEAKESVAPYLQMVQRSVGDPVVCVRDMGKGIEAAILDIFHGVYVVTCHFHFLRNIGMCLFDPIYPQFRDRVYRTGVIKKLRMLRKHCLERRSSLERDQAVTFLNVILAYKKDGTGLAYPFSLPVVDLYRRCEEIQGKLHGIILENAKDNLCSPCLSRLQTVLHLLKPPPVVYGWIHADFERLLNRWQWFERVRNALRYRNGLIPLNTDGSLSQVELEKGRKMIDVLLDDMTRYIQQKDLEDGSLKKALGTVIQMVKKRRDELFVPNAWVTVDGKTQLRKLPRTNNCLEQDFRRIRRHARRIRGDMDVERSVQRDGVGMAIVENLSIDTYVRSMYGSLELMAERFAMVSDDALENARSLFLKK